MRRIICIFLLPLLMGFTLPKKKSSGEFAKELQKDIQRVTSSIEVVNKELQKTKKESLRPDLLLQMAELWVEKSKYQYFLARERDPQKIQSPLDAPEAVRSKEQAIDTYRKILSRYPNHLNNDKVIFFLAQELAQTGQEEEENRQYSKLIRHYPKSEFRDDAMMILGNKAFDSKEINRAISFYQNILEAPEGSLHNMARYKLAWCYVNKEEFGQAMALFEKIAKSKIDSPSETGKGNLQKEALVDSVLCYTKVRKPENAISYYRELADSNSTYTAVLDKLANRFYIQKQYKEAAPLYRELIRKTNNLEPKIEYLTRLFGNLREVGYAGPIDEDAEILIDSLRQYIYSWKIPKADRAQTLSLFEKYLRDATTRLHLKAQQENNSDIHRKAAKAYHAYLSLFEKGNKALKMKMNAAEAYFSGKEFLKSAQLYLELAEFTNDSRRANQWLHSAIVSFFEALKKPDALTKIELVQARYGFLRSGGQFVQRFPRSSYAPDVQFTIGKIYYDENEWDQAIQQFSQFVFSYPQHSKAVNAGRLLLDCYNMKDDTKGMVAVGKQMMQKSGIRDPKFLAELQDVVSKAEFKRVEDSLDSQGGSASASSEFFRLSQEYKGTEAGEKALYNLFVSAKKAGQPAQMIRAAEQLRKDYPKSEFLDKTLPILSQTLIQAGLFQLGVSRAESFSKSYPQSEISSDLLLQAGRIRTALGHYPEAIADFQLALRSKKAQKTQIIEAMVRAADEAQDWKTLESVASHLRDLDPSNAKALNWIFKAQIKQRKLSQASSTISQARTRAKREEDSSQRLELLAELAFWETEPLFQEFQEVQIEQRGVGEEAKVTKKTQLLEQLEKNYTRVASMGSGTWAIAALFQVGQTYQEFAQFLSQTSIPKGLDPSQTAQYKSLMVEKIKEMKTNSTQLYSTCRKKVQEIRIFTKEALQCVQGKPLPQVETPRETSLGKSSFGQLRTLIQPLISNPEDSRGLNEVGRFYLSNDKPSSALLTFSRSHEVDSSKAETANLMGIAFYRMGHYQEAYMSFTSALKKNPSFIPAKANLGRMCNFFKDSTCAKKAFSGLSQSDVSSIPPTDAIQ